MTWSAYSVQNISTAGTALQPSEITVAQNLSTFGVITSDLEGKWITGLSGSTSGWADMRGEYFDNYLLDTYSTYSITLSIEPRTTGNGTAIGYGLYLRDGTGKIHWFGTRDLGVTGGNLGLLTYTTNSFGGVLDDGTGTPTTAHNIRSFRVRQDLTTRYFDYSYTVGNSGPWTNFATRTKNYHLTPNRIGWFGYFGSSGGSVRLRYFRFSRDFVSL